MGILRVMGMLLELLRVGGLIGQQGAFVGYPGCISSILEVLRPHGGLAVIYHPLGLSLIHI